MSDQKTSGFRTLKGHGSRLVRSITQLAAGKTEVDDWHNYMVTEGTSDWKKGLSFERAYAYQSATKVTQAHHLYRVIVTRQRGLDVLCIAYGRTSGEAWTHAYTALFEKGLMPEEEYSARMRDDGADAA